VPRAAQERQRGARDHDELALGRIDAVVALEIGADDYVVKPLRLRELAARIAAHLRRTRMESSRRPAIGWSFRDLVIDVTSGVSTGLGRRSS